MGTFRSKENQDSYDEHRKNGHLDNGCVLCAEASLQEFIHWRIIPNEFPYDRISEVHHMLIPKRHVQETELTEAEITELMVVKHNQLNANYMYVIEALPGMKSIPQHFHLHLIVAKDLSQ